MTASGSATAGISANLPDADRECFVVMPFGAQIEGLGGAIDFDEVYRELIQPSVRAAGMASVRCDEIEGPGSIHADMIESLYRSDVTIVDVTSHNPNVFYELGVRHALRRSTTLLIQARGVPTPFNIHGFKVIEYDPSDLAATRSAITSSITAGTAAGRCDSLVHSVLDLRVVSRRDAAKKAVHRYRVSRAANTVIEVIAGEIQDVVGVDLWVNSENTNMQMARFYDRSVSGVIRYLGARKNRRRAVVEDTVADALGDAMEDQQSVDPATVLVTTAGDLQRSHGVRRILHVATVHGAVGGGYRPVADIARCVRNTLDVAESEECCDGDRRPRAILFPLIGTGAAAQDATRSSIATVLGAAVDHVAHRPDGCLDRICFAALTDEDVTDCCRVLDGLREVERVSDPVVDVLPDPRP
jgi:hypothetical protein